MIAWRTAIAEAQRPQRAWDGKEKTGRKPA